MAPINNDNICPKLPRSLAYRKRYINSITLENYRQETTAESTPIVTSRKVRALVSPVNGFLPSLKPFKSLGLTPEKQ